MDTDGTNQTIFDMVHDWPKLYNSIKNCEDVLPCQRVIYEDFIEQRSPTMDFGLNGWISGNDSSVTIQYANPYIQVIKDSVSYDFQSLIGEVGVYFWDYHSFRSLILLNTLSMHLLSRYMN